MPISLVNVDELQEHLLGVLRRSDHHAGDVNEVLLTISGAILWRKNPSDPVKVNTKEGAGGNVIWFRVEGTRYALLYNHVESRIELTEGGRKGELLHTFTNATPTAEVVRVFAGLGEGVLELSKSRKVRKEDRDPKEAKSREERQRIKAERLQAKQARAGTRDDKVRAKRDERREVRAAGKVGRPQPWSPPDAAESGEPAQPARRRTAKAAPADAALN
jgi:Integron cassette protein VCH_CASS1 chain